MYKRCKKIKMYFKNYCNKILNILFLLLIATKYGIIYKKGTIFDTNIYQSH